MSPINLNQTLAQAARRLESSGIDSGAVEAEIILCHLLDCDRLELFLEGAKRLTPELLERFDAIVERRKSRYPLQYILGEAYFYGRRFVVNESVLVPTPETELLCENAVRYLLYRKETNPLILDMGCGCGVIAVTVKLEYPRGDVIACDISESALAVARSNAKALLAGDVKFVESDLFSAFAEDERFQNAFDLILSNPPYIGDIEYPALPPEVKADPRVALTSGPEGMDLIVKLVDEAPRFLKSDGRLMFEIGYNQAEKVRALVEKDNRYESIVIMKDLNDIDRIVILSLAM